MKENVKKKLPEIKKNIKDFISDESGFVSKEKILKASFAVGFATLALVNTAAADHTSHTNSISGSFSGSTVTGSHTHHGSHSSY